MRILPVVLCCVALMPAAARAADGPNLRGFAPPDAREEFRWEERFRSLPSPDTLRESLRRLSARPHHLGSAYDRDNAWWMLGRYKSFGLDARIDSFSALFPTPRERRLELVSPGHFTASLQEPGLPMDLTSNQQAEQLPTYNAYSIDGDVTAPLVYVNYGIPADYEQLDRLGISVKGCIVIARYGASWRGIKPKVAAEHGALGCILYSDPRGDGYFNGDSYPGGPNRPREGVQRGSVMDMPVHPGDPLTPGWGSTAGSRRLAMKDVDVFTRIPVLPISYSDAQPLLAALGGPVAPEAWRGALPLTYHVGVGPARVHLKLAFDWSVKPLYDVVARIPGSSRPDQWVVRGNHHDAWVNGAEDPLSGQVAMLEEARALGQLVREGWKPRRTIIFCSWDGEEEGLLGSTEWTETNGAELQKHAVLYINSDSNNRGFLDFGGSHSLEKYMNEVARDVTDPETRISALQRLKLSRLKAAATAEERDALRARTELRLDALGSGSDYSSFLQHFGIPSLNLGYGGEGGGENYHSIYDDFYWYTKYCDTTFAYGCALAQTAGTAVLRMADAPLAPYDFENQAETVGKYLEELQKLLKTRQDEARERGKQLSEGLFAATSDPRHPQIAPPALEMPPFLDFSPLQNAQARLAAAGTRYGAASRDLAGLAAVSMDSASTLLQGAEQKLLGSPGLPRRPWYRHLLYAPGFYTGYGVKTVPGVREAIEAGSWKEAGEQIQAVSAAVSAEADLVSVAAGILERGRR